ncbi:MAG: RDD family protein [Kiritimatiellia bacterium]
MNERMWYYATSGQQEGPVTEKVLVEMLQSRRLSGDAMVWTEELKDWVKASSVKGLLSDSLQAPMLSPPPLTAQAVRPPTPYAGFWRRFAAILIDAVVLFVVGFIVGFVVGAVMGGVMVASGADMISINEAVETVGRIVGMVLNWLYFTLLESSPAQATLGKMALGIQVTDMNGNRIGFARANGRYWSKLVSILLLFAGYVMVAFTKRKQGLHDMMAGCLVVKKQSPHRC